ncbi:Hypothetical Protein FCC1311_117742, partial [Hondaea fermentalgiana]
MAEEGVNEASGLPYEGGNGAAADAGHDHNEDNSEAAGGPDVETGGENTGATENGNSYMEQLCRKMMATFEAQQADFKTQQQDFKAQQEEFAARQKEFEDRHQKAMTRAEEEAQEDIVKLFQTHLQKGGIREVIDGFAGVTRALHKLAHKHGFDSMGHLIAKVEESASLRQDMYAEIKRNLPLEVLDYLLEQDSGENDRNVMAIWTAIAKLAGECKPRTDQTGPKHSQAERGKRPERTVVAKSGARCVGCHETGHEFFIFKSDGRLVRNCLKRLPQEEFAALRQKALAQAKPRARRVQATAVNPARSGLQATSERDDHVVTAHPTPTAKTGCSELSVISSSHSLENGLLSEEAYFRQAEYEGTIECEPRNAAAVRTVEASRTDPTNDGPDAAPAGAHSGSAEGDNQGQSPRHLGSIMVFSNEDAAPLTQRPYAKMNSWLCDSGADVSVMSAQLFREANRAGVPLKMAAPLPGQPTAVSVADSTPHQIQGYATCWVALPSHLTVGGSLLRCAFAVPADDYRSDELLLGREVYDELGIPSLEQQVGEKLSGKSLDTVEHVEHHVGMEDVIAGFGVEPDTSDDEVLGTAFDHLGHAEKISDQDARV